MAEIKVFVPKCCKNFCSVSRFCAGGTGAEANPSGGVKQGRFGILRFPLFCRVWGFQDNQML